MRTDKEGRSFLTFGVKVPVKSTSPDDNCVEISVSKEPKPGEQPSDYMLDRRVIVDGVLLFRKKGEVLYLNLSANDVDLNAGEQAEEISGTMEFRGTVGKQPVQRVDKKGQPYWMCSAYSAEKVGDEFAYTWVRFMQFHADKPEWLAEKAYVQAKGDLDLTLYNGRPQLGCTLAEVAPQQKWSATH
jgi:hypothetical protein